MLAWDVTRSAPPSGRVTEVMTMKKTQIALMMSAFVLSLSPMATSAKTIYVKAGQEATITDAITLKADSVGVNVAKGASATMQGTEVTGTGAGIMVAKVANGTLDMNNVTVKLDADRGFMFSKVLHLLRGQANVDGLNAKVKTSMASWGLHVMDGDLHVANSTLDVTGTAVDIQRSKNATLKNTTLSVSNEIAATGLKVDESNVLAEKLTVKSRSKSTAQLVNAVWVKGTMEESRVVLKDSDIDADGGNAALFIEPGHVVMADNTKIFSNFAQATLVAGDQFGQANDDVMLTLSNKSALGASFKTANAIVGSGKLVVNDSDVFSIARNFAKGDVQIEASNGAKIEFRTQNEAEGAVSVKLENSTLNVGQGTALNVLEMDAGSNVGLSRFDHRVNLKVKELKGNGGTLNLWVELGDDNALTDSVSIDQATGTTNLKLDSFGKGAKTTNGIKLVSVADADTTADFKLTDRVIAGPLEYTLVRAEGTGDWLLKSDKRVIRMDETVFLPASMLVGDLETRDDRVLEAHKSTGGFWIRGLGSKTESKRFDNVKTSTVGVQMGYEKAFDGNWTGTVFVDAKRTRANFDVDEMGAKQKRFGLGFATTRHFDNDAYVELSLRGSFDRYTVRFNQSEEDVNGQQYVASVEAGHRFAVGKGFVEPQMQVVYTYAKVQDYTLADITTPTVSMDNVSAIAARLGVKAGVETEKSAFWARADLLPRFGGKVVANVSDTGVDTLRVEEKTSGMGYGLSVGASHRFTPNWVIGASLSTTKHHDTKPGVAGNLSFKRSF